jgi:glycosyltransferase involved in cell wall biosynthesis
MKILVINTLKGRNKPLVGLLNALSSRFVLDVRSSDEFLAGSFPGGRKVLFGPAAGGAFDLLFYPFAAVLWPAYFLWLFFAKLRGRFEALLCIGENEKVLLTLPSRILGLKVLWLELPERRHARWSLSTWLLAWFSRFARVVCFTSASMASLADTGFKRENLVVLPPAAESEYAHQDDIFSELAAADKPRTFFKSFSIGTVVDFSDRGHFETLLKAVKNCSNIIPNIQLVVIGSSRERRNLNWLSRKLGIESKVWFVGEQRDLVKWFDSFDMYFALSSDPNLFDLETALLAMSRGVPTAVFKHGNFDDFLVDGQTGLVMEERDADSLAKKIIDVEPDKRFLERLGANAKDLVDGRLNRKNQVDILVKLFE